ncbi:hypothetical protein AGMMS49949_03990 [Alphaproteobacteria bacterium]|nr:hypothetical protein AGMMS49949_03990 [Alphaproteobacteria bacterium]GHS96673.1 hypothetical protein AGMMS50296_3070 [Alphaproteobacteria bacterium]
MFFSKAYAEGAARQGTDVLMSVLPFLLIFVVMYFLMIRPQQKKTTLHQKFISGLKKGDRVVTNAGIVGTISKVKETEVNLDIADNTTITILKNSVAADYAPIAGAPAEKAKEAQASTGSKWGKHAKRKK